MNRRPPPGMRPRLLVVEYAARLEGPDRAVMKEHKEVAINPAILDAYVGVYELAPNFQVTVTREGNSLFAQATAQPKFQLYPESDIEFFLKVVDASFIFVRGATGSVDQIILHQGGASIPGKRVK